MSNLESEIENLTNERVFIKRLFLIIFFINEKAGSTIRIIRLSKWYFHRVIAKEDE